MSEANHTPGPWQLCYGGLPGDDGFSIASKTSRELVCERWPCTCDNRDRERMAADSKLIAAAPEMLEALLAARHAMTNQRYLIPRKGMEEEYAAVARAIEIATPAD